VSRKIKDVCPCDECPKRSKCGQEETECAGVREWYSNNWYWSYKVDTRMKPIPMRNQK